MFCHIYSVTTRKHSSRMHTTRLQMYVLWWPPLEGVSQVLMVGGYTMGPGIPIPLEIHTPPVPNIPTTDILTPRHTHPLLVTPGGYH